MHSSLVVLYLAIAFAGQAQTSLQKAVAASIDEELNRQLKGIVYHLQECDSIRPLGNFKSIYKCWNYVYPDSTGTKVFKVSISFNRRSEELRLFYLDNKIVKRELLKSRKTSSVVIWTVYFKNGQPFYSTGQDPSHLGFDLTEEANSFKQQALDYVKRSRLPLTGIAKSGAGR